jgi:predicted acetyltransferase
MPTPDVSKVPDLIFNKIIRDLFDHPHLPTHEYALVVNGADVGIAQLRMRLSCSADVPPDCASHVYYEVATAWRGRGYATALLGLMRTEAARLGFARLIVVCHAGNLASRRVIEKNGGCLTCTDGDFLRFEVPAA